MDGSNTIDKKLAIVIPAYKPDFFELTLKSIASQTNKNFTLYIGDDASGANLYEIVSRFERLIDIKYVRFEENIGASDLVAHWERCIELINEDWIWLFSDDDMMDNECVASFYAALQENEHEEIFHFDVTIIDHNGSLVLSRTFPRRITASDFLKRKMGGELASFAVEFIFKRSLYLSKDKFQKFDLAWGTDDATWIKFIGRGALLTIPNAKVYWRYSGLNISSSSGGEIIAERKINANIAFLNWLEQFVIYYKFDDQTSAITKLKWMTESFKYEKISLLKKLKFARIATSGVNAGFWEKCWITTYLIYLNVKRFLK
jgi:glycosyltransferase involved in cell wall biosynthesis